MCSVPSRATRCGHAARAMELGFDAVLLNTAVAKAGDPAAMAEGGGPIPAWWIGLNLWAALLHYAYDGMIWKLRRPATAQALGAA